MGRGLLVETHTFRLKKRQTYLVVDFDLVSRQYLSLCLPNIYHYLIII